MADRDYISYSELKSWCDCPWRHKTRYIDDINLSKDSVHTSFGTAIHHFSEYHVKGVDVTEEAVDMIRKNWKDNDFENEDEWVNFARSIMSEIPDFLNAEFPGWELIDAEHELNEPIDESSKVFKGFIDLVLKVKNKKGKEQILILDWKTSRNGWHSMKKRDVLVLMQLVLYKKYLSKKLNIDIKDIKCGFGILKYDGEPGKRCEFLPVSAGPKTIEKAELKIKSLIKNVENKKFFKNRTSCSYCDYRNTEHCKGFSPKHVAK